MILAVGLPATMGRDKQGRRLAFLAPSLLTLCRHRALLNPGPTNTSGRPAPPSLLSQLLLGGSLPETATLTVLSLLSLGVATRQVSDALGLS